MNKSVADIIEFIVTFLVDTTGNEIFEKWKSKRKISKILKEDSKNIERIFYAIRNSDLYNLIEEFIIFTAFKEVSFYSPMDLTKKQEAELWEKFLYFLKKENGVIYVSDEYRDKIIKCINLHNKAINNIILDAQGNFQMKMMQSQYSSIKDSLNHLMDTLNTETKLQDKDDELNFGIEQLEMIMKSYKFDMNFLRKIQIISICGALIILLFMSIFIPFSLKYVMNEDSRRVMYGFLSIVVILILIFWGYISYDLYKLEKQMKRMRTFLWEIHFNIYTKMIYKKYDLVNEMSHLDRS